MDLLEWRQLSAVVTSLFGALQFWQLLHRYDEVVQRVNEVREFLASAEGAEANPVAGFNIVHGIIYLLLPALYLGLLYQSEAPVWVMFICVVKFSISAALGWWVERRALGIVKTKVKTEPSDISVNVYSLTHHRIGQVDILFNLGILSLCAWALVQ